MKKSYPKKVRDRARELFLENPELSYSDIAQILREEFPEELPRPPNKTTIRLWVKDLRDKRYKKEEPDNVEKPEEKPKEISDDKVPEEFKDLPRITPPEIAEMLAEKSTVVEEEVSIDEIDEIVDEEEPEESSGFLDKLPLPGGKITLVLLTVSIIGIILYLLFRRKKEDEKPKSTVSNTPPEPKSRVKASPKVAEL